MRILLDAGHGGTETGAISYNGIPEKQINLVITLECGRILKQNGIDVRYTRTQDTTIALSARTNFANSIKADYYISIHNNAFNKEARGIETIFSIYGGKGEQLAHKIADNLHKDTGNAIRRIFNRKGTDGRDYYHVIRETNMPAVIVECAFIDNQLDYSLIDTEAEQKAYGRSIAYAILEFLEIPYKYDFEQPTQAPNPDQWKYNTLQTLVDNKLINNYDDWVNKLNEPAPTWLIFEMIKKLKELK